MEAVGALRSYVERATGLPLDARCWSAWVIVAGKTELHAGAADRGTSVRYAASDLHTQDAGAMLPSDPS